MEICVELLKTIEWSIGVDPQVIASCIGDGAILKQLAQVIIGEWGQARAEGVDLARFAILKRGRLIARLLTIMCRDHNLIAAIDQKNDNCFAGELWRLTMKNLQYVYFVFFEFSTNLDRETFETQNLSHLMEDSSQDFADLEQEMKAMLS